ncbi:hypothetical protein ACP2AV_09225 [Aliiroseovarius sp. PTFE2010]|uniref:hypothetical protein n=1 Tax=Aliiroseovarius sp. PTFE2010 TaxID=3417190 RepID=UPI003CF622FC
MKFDPGPGPSPSSSYPQGFDAIHDRIQHARRAFDFRDGDLPALDIDLDALRARTLPDLGPYDGPHVPATDFAGRRTKLAHEFSGQSELDFLVAQLIMMSRRVNFPQDMQVLWHRIWDEQADNLIETLDNRWKISAIRTFGSHGLTEAERRLGNEMFLVLGMMKLGDTDRSFLGLGPAQVPKLGNRKKGKLALGLSPFSVTNGDLDLHVLNQIHGLIQANAGRPSGKLGADLFRQIDADERTVFRRLMTIRHKFLKARRA